MIRVFVPRGLDLDILREANPQLVIKTYPSGEYFDIESKTNVGTTRVKVCTRCGFEKRITNPMAIREGWRIKGSGVRTCPTCMRGEAS